MEETRGQFLKKLKKKKIEEKKILAEMISLEKFVRKQHAQIENNIVIILITHSLVRTAEIRPC